ncbi:hypothetical protein AB0M58_13170 [Streptomyces bobili]
MMSVAGASHELSAAERKEIDAKARIPRSRRQGRARRGRPPIAEEHRA